MNYPNGTEGSRKAASERKEDEQLINEILDACEKRRHSLGMYDLEREYLKPFFRKHEINPDDEVI
jgi:hypothetical protein